MHGLFGLRPSPKFAASCVTDLLYMVVVQCGSLLSDELARMSAVQQAAVQKLESAITELLVERHR
jgi:hypothetical protein